MGQSRTHLEHDCHLLRKLDAVLELKSLLVGTDKALCFFIEGAKEAETVKLYGRVQFIRPHARFVGSLG